MAGVMYSDRARRHGWCWSARRQQKSSADSPKRPLATLQPPDPDPDSWSEKSAWGAATSLAVAELLSRPFNSGMAMSRTMTSGFSVRAAATNARPSAAAPMTSNSASSRRLKASSNRMWSSASRTFVRLTPLPRDPKRRLPLRLTMQERSRQIKLLGTSCRSGTRGGFGPASAEDADSCSSYWWKIAFRGCGGIER